MQITFKATLKYKLSNIIKCFFPSWVTVKDVVFTFEYF